MKEEILFINILRFLAAFAILCVHKFAYLVEIDYLPGILSILTPFTEYGYLGVNLFFLISGFVISLSSENRTVGQFISARFVRLFPVFWICVLITSLMVIFTSVDQIITLKQFLANLTMVPHTYGEYQFIDGSYWTLGVELRFYSMIALILLIRPFVNLSLEKISFFLSIPLLYYTLYHNPYHISSVESIFQNVIYFFGAEYTQYFIGGIALYGIYRNKKKYYLYITFFICYVVAMLRALDQAYPSNDPKIIAFHITLFFGLFFAISLKRITNEMFSFLGSHGRKTIITLGAITYPLYLLHSAVINLTIEILQREGLPPYIASPILISFVVILVLMVNSLDIYIRSFWKNSFILQNILSRTNILWLRKII